MKNSTSLNRKTIVFPFHSLRNISCPEDLKNDRRVYTGQAPVSSILELPTNANVRGYLVEAEGKQKRTYTSVHKAIRNTLEDDPENFSILNNGVVIVARDIEVDENSKIKILKLVGPSIINGSQTQGVLNDLKERDRLPVPEVHVKYEIIVMNDEDLIAETSIARNFQNDVMSISIAGRKGQFDELEVAFKKVHPSLKLRKSESEIPTGETVDTEKLIQVITALTPNELWPKDGEKDNPNKVYTYSMKAKCLKEFQEVFRKAHDSSDLEHKDYKKLYEFYLDISGDAWSIYRKWKSHAGFKGTGLKNGIVRDGDEIVEVADGIVFPIIASLAVFAKHSRGGWRISPPEFFDEIEVIKSAKQAITEIAAHNPWNMGKSKACYSHILQITSLYKKLTPHG
ncbi:MAG: AIPR family protein [Bacteroidota bacterium]